MKRHTCILCDESKPVNEMVVDYAHNRIIFKCYDCVQDVYAIEYGYDQEDVLV